MKKTETKLFGELTVNTNQLPAMASLALMARLGRVAGPAFARILPHLDKDMNITDVSVLAPALESLFSTMDGQDAQGLVREIFSCTSVVINGKHLELNTDANINAAFTGQMKTMLAVLRFVVGVNYGDFTDGASTDQPSDAPPKPAG